MLYRWRNKSWRYRGIAAGLKAGKSMDELIEEFKVSGHTILVIAMAEGIQLAVPCAACEGSGYMNRLTSTARTACSACHGTGLVARPKQEQSRDALGNTLGTKQPE